MPSHRTLLDLTRRYLEPHRHYHTIEHIAAMLHHARDLALTDEQVLAIWFHDAIYDVHSDRNEEDSARLAVELLTRDGYAEESINAVEAIVLDTKSHEPTIEESKLVIDLDLASLALPWDEFTRNHARVRREYAAFGDREFTAGNAAFLGRLLARERIYWSAWGARLEAAARANLERVVRDATADGASGP